MATLWIGQNGVESFFAKTDSSNISKDKKMSHLKTLLVGKTKRAVNGMGYACAMCDHAWKTLQRKFR